MWHWFVETIDSMCWENTQLLATHRLYFVDEFGLQVSCPCAHDLMVLLHDISVFLLSFRYILSRSAILFFLLNCATKVPLRVPLILTSYTYCKLRKVIYQHHQLMLCSKISFTYTFSSFFLLSFSFLSPQLCDQSSTSYAFDYHFLHMLQVTSSHLSTTLSADVVFKDNLKGGLLYVSYFSFLSSFFPLNCVTQDSTSCCFYSYTCCKLRQVT